MLIDPKCQCASALGVVTQMIRALKIVIQVIWAVSMVAAGTLIGAAFGWANHGWSGAIVLGTIGFGVGAFLASYPSALFELLR